MRVPKISVPKLGLLRWTWRRVETTPEVSTSSRLVERPPKWASVYPCPSAQLKDFFGREAELEKVEKALMQDGGVTIYGPSGGGKTALVVQAINSDVVRRRFGDKISWVRVGGASLEDICDCVVRSCGGAGVPLSGTFDEGKTWLWKLLGQEPHLIVLDGVASGNERNIQILSTMVGAQVLVTSLNPVPGLPAIPVGALDTKSSGRLLRARIQRALLPEDEGQINSLAQAVGHIPLALVLTAGQFVSAERSVAEVVSSLQELRQKVGKQARGDARFSSIVALEGAFGVLPPEVQAAFVALGSLDGWDFDLNAVLALQEEVGPPWLSSLVRRHLVEFDGSRYRLHPLVHAFAYEQTIATAGADARNRLGNYFLNLSKSNNQPSKEDFDALETELGNLLAVVDTERPQTTVPEQAAVEQAKNLVGLYGSVRQMLLSRGYWRRLIYLANKARQAATLVKDVGAESAVVLDIALARERLKEWEEAEQSYDLALRLKEQAQDKSSVATIHSSLGLMKLTAGELNQARTEFSEALRLELACMNQRGVANNTYWLAAVERAHARNGQGSLGRAERLCNEALDVARSAGDEVMIPQCLALLGGISEDRQEALNQSRKILEHELEICRKLGDERNEARVLSQMGSMASQHGSFLESRHCLEESLRIQRKNRDEGGLADTLYHLGKLAHKQGNLGEALQHYVESLSWAQQRNDHRRVALVEGEIGRLSEAQGNPQEALIHYKSSFSILEKMYEAYAGTEAAEIETEMDILQVSIARLARQLGRPVTQQEERRASL